VTSVGRLAEALAETKVRGHTRSLFCYPSQFLHTNSVFYVMTFLNLYPGKKINNYFLPEELFLVLYIINYLHIGLKTSVKLVIVTLA